MFLQRLVLQNMRSIAALDFPFTNPDGTTRKWTMLLGENGSGKSTVLRALALLLAGSEALPELIGDIDPWVRAGSDECLLHADLVTADGQPREIELRLRRGDTLRDVFTRNEAALDRLDRALRHSVRNYPTLGYGVSRRMNPSSTPHFGASEVFRHPRAQNVSTLFSADATLNPLESWAIDLHYRRGEEGLALIRSILSDLLPGATFERIDREERRLWFSTADGSLPLSYLSEGYQNVAAWYGDLLYRIMQTFADYKNPFSARGLLLIDELDLHLHPVWQRQLVLFLNEKLTNLQIVATTHSPLTAHQAGEGELFVLRREQRDQPPTLYQYPGVPRNLMLHQLLLSPIFGLETVDSKQVELWRAEYHELEGRPRAELSAAERKRLAELRQELTDLPDWSAETPLQRQQRTLLEEIQQTLQSKGTRRKGRGGRG